MKYAPIALFVYKRLDYLTLTWEALKKNVGASESQVFVFSDGPKNANDAEQVQRVRDYLHANQDGFRSVTFYEQPANRGLAGSIAAGVTRLCDEFGRVIVVEDDIVTAPYFLQFMNEGLDFFENDLQVATIAGYIPPLDIPPESRPEFFFMNGIDCWGWATWKNRWVDFIADPKALRREIARKQLRKVLDERRVYPVTNWRMLKLVEKRKISSWAVPWQGSMVLAGRLSCFPGQTLVNNIGGTNGTNCNYVDGKSLNDALHMQPISYSSLPIVPDKKLIAAYRRYSRRLRLDLIIGHLRHLLLRKG